MLDLARTDLTDQFAERTRQREEIGDAIGSRHDHHYTEWQHRQIVLLLGFAVHRHERIGEPYDSGALVAASSRIDAHDGHATECPRRSSIVDEDSLT